MSDNHKKDQTTPSSSSGSSNHEKNVLQNVSDYYNQALFWYRNIDVKGTVGKYRENINQVVFDNPILKQIEHWPHKPKEVAAEIDRDLRAVSVKFNDSFPYAASMCRSHSTFVLGSFLAITILPLWGRGTYKHIHIYTINNIYF